MSQHEDELLADLVLGLRREDDPAVGELLARPGMRERLAELRSAAAALDEAALRSREVLAAARRLRDAPGETRVAHALRQLAGGGPSAAPDPARPSRRSLLWLLPIAAAAAAAALLLVLRRAPDPGGATGDRGPRLLGEGSLEPIAPGATFSDDLVFQWRGELALGERYRVRVFDASDPLALEPVRTSPTTTEERWRPSDPGELPDEIRWSVERLGRDGSVRASAEAWSRRSP